MPQPGPRDDTGAPGELAGRWLQADPDALAMRGRVTLLFFWSADCVDCGRSWQELLPVRAGFGPEVVTFAVHSPRFPHQAEPGVLAPAVRRLGIDAAVLDDVRLEAWTRYGVSAWPTLVVVDPLGEVAAHVSGELHPEPLRALVEELIATHRVLGTLRPGTDPYRAPPPPPHGDLLLPTKLLQVPAERLDDGQPGLLVADTGASRLVLLGPDLSTPRLTIGHAAGLLDGGPGEARFRSPAGMALLPGPVADAVGYDVVVADTGNHALRGVRLRDGAVTTLAGTGNPMPGRAAPSPGAPALGQPLAAPMDVAWFQGFVAVAMAGADQLWAFVPGLDPAGGRIGLLAGSGSEGLVDGPARRAWFAQPTALDATPDGETLWIADAQSSALRWLRRSPAGGYEVGTGVGQGLFESGFRDGRRREALLQHPAGVSALADGTIAVVDTYNGAVRRFDPVLGVVTTLAGGLAEPSDAVRVGDALVVAESGGRRLRRLRPDADVRSGGPAGDGPLRRVEVHPGTVTVEVRFTPPPGQELDERAGSPTTLSIRANPPDLLTGGVGAGSGTSRLLRFPDPDDGGPTTGVLHISLIAVTTGTEHLKGEQYQQDWALPVRIDRDGAHRIAVDLRAAPQLDRA